MSEERLERIENQLTQVIQAVSGMQQNMTVMQQSIIVMQQNMTVMQQNIDSTRGALLTVINDGFTALNKQVNDLNIDLTVNEKKTEDNARKIRRVNQRLMQVEDRHDEI
jgi:predicted  nucleic acid-binding Zn-ribbon protein